MEHKLAIGTMLGISTGCEPFFALSFNRRTETMSGETYKVDIKAVEEYRKATGNQGKLPDYFITSEEIPWIERINIQAALQEYCDTAISSTVNLKKETSIDEVKELYIYAWQKGCKGITIYRNGSRDPILFTEPTKEEKISEQVSLNTKDAKLQLETEHGLQRGEVIPTSNHWLGLKRKLITGCGSLHVNSYWDPETGELRECYLSKGSTGGCQNFMIGLSRMISLAARGGLSIEAILDQLKSCGTCPSYAVRQATKHDTSKGSCCPVAVGNALREMSKEIQDIICECKDEHSSNYYQPADDSLFKENVKQGWYVKINEKEVDLIDPTTTQVEVAPDYVENNLEECPSCHEKTLIHAGGCLQCNSCGYSKCN